MRALILDDESLPGKHLEKMLEKHCFEVTYIKVFISASKAIKHLENEEYDIIFLDVEMPEMNGFEFLNHANIPHNTEIIFTTAYSQYALDAFKVNALHYILKPIQEEELIMAVRKVMHARDSEKSGDKIRRVVSVFDGKEYRIIQVKEIIRLQADKGYTKFILTKNRKILTSKRLGYYEDKFLSLSFCRCHNSHFINIEHLESISKGRNIYVTLSNDDIVPVSSSHKAELYEIIGE